MTSDEMTKRLERAETAANRANMYEIRAATLWARGFIHDSKGWCLRACEAWTEAARLVDGVVFESEDPALDSLYASFRTRACECIDRATKYEKHSTTVKQTA